MTTLAERLGYAPEAKLLIIHCDDFGMCHSQNVGTAEVLERGVANSTSIMTPCPWRDEAIAYAVAHPDVDVGMHCTLTSEWDLYRWGPVAPVATVPSLVDADGYLWKNEPPFAAHADPDDAARELRAQHALLREAGVDLTHVDMHMQALVSGSAFFDVYVQLADEVRLPFMFPDPNSGFRQFFDPDYTLVSKEQEEALLARGLFVIDRLVMNVATGRPRAPQYAEVIRGLDPGLTQIITHVSTDTDEIRAAAVTEGEDGFTYRLEDRAALLDPLLTEVIAECDVELVTWRQIRDLLYG